MSLCVPRLPSLNCQGRPAGQNIAQLPCTLLSGRPARFFRTGPTATVPLQYAKRERTMGKINTVTLTPAIGGVVQGVDLSKQLDDEQIADIRAALLKHKV